MRTRWQNLKVDRNGYQTIESTLSFIYQFEGVCIYGQVNVFSYIDLGGWVGGELTLFIFNACNPLQGVTLFCPAIGCGRNPIFISAELGKSALEQDRR